MAQGKNKKGLRLPEGLRNQNYMMNKEENKRNKTYEWQQSPGRLPNVIQKCSPELQMRIEYDETLMSIEACVL